MGMSTVLGCSLYPCELNPISLTLCHLAWPTSKIQGMSPHLVCIPDGHELNVSEIGQAWLIYKLIMPKFHSS